MRNLILYDSWMELTPGGIITWAMALIWALRCWYQLYTGFSASNHNNCENPTQWCYTFVIIILVNRHIKDLCMCLQIIVNSMTVIELKQVLKELHINSNGKKLSLQYQGLPIRLIVSNRWNLKKGGLSNRRSLKVSSLINKTR